MSRLCTYFTIQRCVELFSLAQPPPLAEKIMENLPKKAKSLQGHRPSGVPSLEPLSDDIRGSAKGGKSLSCLSLVKKIMGKFSKDAKTLESCQASGVPSFAPSDDTSAGSKGDNKGGNLPGMSLAKGIKGMFSKRPKSWKDHQASRAPSASRLPSPAVNTRGDAKGGIGGGTGAGSIRKGVLSVLHVVHASLDGVPVPGLKSVIGGLLEVVSQLERVGANAEAIHQLQNSIKFFVHSILEPLKQYGAKNPVPHGISRAIEAVSTYVYCHIRAYPTPTRLPDLHPLHLRSHNLPLPFRYSPSVSATHPSSYLSDPFSVRSDTHLGPNISLLATLPTTPLPPHHTSTLPSSPTLSPSVPISTFGPDYSSLPSPLSFLHHPSAKLRPSTAVPYFTPGHRSYLTPSLRHSPYLGL
ncbi:uncharacterized protein EI90DRAFT_3124271 [Cantharellus anzutake]|uniref:uncharacterized protein n=1 Tax=Cantharellus anzutake TaxID=1750568 RepID=UPI001903EE70|nr:uncharacterized protein EI90DRAFT_3124271 [Cantharellus anzutake]KAF8330591.1 hypothetical protein EI90DRAFT_3124271 [Cantharellus anzutake]